MNVRHLFIVNPAAGKKDISSKIAHFAVEAAENLGAEHTVHITECPGDAVSYIRAFLNEHSDDFVRVYACGGDGTLNEAVNGVFGFDNAAVGSVPTGSGNDFIKTITERPKEAFLSFSDMMTGDIRRIDALRIDDRISINIISTGFDAATAKGMHTFKRLPLVSGSAAYCFALIKALFTARHNHYRFELDGQELEGAEGDYLFAIAANGRWYGGGFKAAPLADLSDGKIDFIYIRTVSIFKFLKLVGVFRKGEHLARLPIAKMRRCEKLKIITGKTVDVNIDGEIAEGKDVEISIVKNALNLIIPHE